jgi:hypothetical protein
MDSLPDRHAERKVSSRHGRKDSAPSTHRAFMSCEQRAGDECSFNQF